MALPLYDNDALHEGLKAHVGCKVELVQYEGDDSVLLECIKHGSVLLVFESPDEIVEEWHNEEIIEIAQSAGLVATECTVHRHVWVRHSGDECGTFLEPTEDGKGVKEDDAVLDGDGSAIARTRSELRKWLEAHV